MAKPKTHKRWTSAGDSICGREGVVLADDWGLVDCRNCLRSRPAPAESVHALIIDPDGSWWIPCKADGRSARTTFDVDGITCRICLTSIRRED